MDRTVSFRIDDARLSRLDALVVKKGGRGPFLRQMVDAVLRSTGVQKETAPSPIVRSPEGTSDRIYLRLDPAEADAVRRHANARQMPAATWVTTLVRRHVDVSAPVEAGLREELLNCRQQLQRIGRNINQLAKAANTAALAENASEIAMQLRPLQKLRAEVKSAVDAIGQATMGELSYWDGPDA